MKKILLYTFLFISTISYAQDQNQISISLGVGKNGILQDESLHSSTIKGEQFNSIELRYVHNFVKRFNRRKVWAIETGIFYSLHEVIVNEPSSSRFENIVVFSIPTFIRYNFYNYFYISGGPIFSKELISEEFDYRSKQDGMGIGIEFGGEYHISKNILLIINPFVRQYNLVQFNKTVYHDALTEYGVKFGVAYEF